jgi:preprotein translocase subunit SecG
MSLLLTLLYLLFALSCLLLIVVILIQEGKGGGLGDAFGGAGAQTFGVGASGITRFTSWIGAFFLASAVAITLIEKRESRGLLEDSLIPEITAPVTPPEGE